MTTPLPYEKKIIHPSKLETFNRPLVFTNGCFDLLHRGHVTYLAQARAFGSSLLVAINSDASVRRLNKGPDRPINTLEDRLHIIAALECVSAVTWFEEDNPLNLILRVRPDVLVKGGDWLPEKIIGGNEVISWGGEVHSIPFLFDRSTSSMLKKIRTLY
ncbi:MAG: D-glycero-beta-D-manno-heptose 1-phosphate adenylyltransferase [Proteobacteria bacterium]|nr:D-glycero-beta-D-manno-heptose 1-phosphate adenylyltransferase [Pseudomonadota bacterium]MDE3208638.1 D-glycero-beta-D-manno-heptose 1-phosphate adenylyltransferase [Pseudomonadota bacterium]